MRKTIWQTVFLLGGLVAVASQVDAVPVPGTCTVKRMASTAKVVLGDRTIAIPPATDFVFPVTVDAEQGRFTFDRTGWTKIVFNTPGGGPASIDFDRDVLEGTIDAAGNITLPNFSVTFFANFCMDERRFVPTLSTGTIGTVFGEAVYESSGVPLDFTTGELTLEGHVPGRLCVPTTTGVRLTCVLSPIPVRSAFSKKPLQLTGVGGKARITSGLTDGDKGDTVALKAKLVAGDTPLALDGTEDLIVLVANGNRNLVVLLVRKGKFRSKGARLIASRDDACVIKRNVGDTGTCRAVRGRSCKTADDCSPFDSLRVDVVVGRKDNGTAKSVVAGTIGLTKRGAISVKAQGLDLGGLDEGPLRVSVQVGGQTASVPVTVTGTGLVRRLRGQK